MTPSFTTFIDHTQRSTTLGRTPLDEWSALRRDPYLTTHSTHNKHPCPRWDSNEQAATLLEFHVPFTNCFVCRWFCVVHDPKPPLHSHNWLSFGKFQDTARFLIHCERHFSSRLPRNGGTWKYAKAPSIKKTWRDSLPNDMLLSAVSVLVVAQSSPEIPEGLMNNPVYLLILQLQWGLKLWRTLCAFSDYQRAIMAIRLTCVHFTRNVSMLCYWLALSYSSSYCTTLFEGNVIYFCKTQTSLISILPVWCVLSLFRHRMALLRDETRT